MDGIPGWHAQRRARKVLFYVHLHPWLLIIIQEDELLSIRRPDGRYSQTEEISPMHENFIGGFYPGQPPPSPAPPALPPKDYLYAQPGYHVQQPTQSTITSSQLSHMTAVERSQTLRVARMNPHLQVCCLTSTAQQNSSNHRKVVHGWSTSTVCLDFMLERTRLPIVVMIPWTRMVSGMALPS